MRARRGGCPSPDLILAARSEVLQEEISKKILFHLETGPSCAALGRDMTDPEIADANADEQTRIKERIEQESKTRKAAFGWGCIWSRALPSSVLIVLLAG